MSDTAPRGVRLVIALAGRRNAGKSSLINALCGQDIAIVSEHPGTTTDPVAKHYELLPFGPVTFYDTAGLDDEGELGTLRIEATRKVLWRADVAVIVVGSEGITNAERDIASRIRELDIPCVVAFNKRDLRGPSEADAAWCAQNGLTAVEVSAREGLGVDALKTALIDAIPAEMREEPMLCADLVTPGQWVTCVVPIDLSAPKGRLILPQVQVLRDILDADATGIVVKEHDLAASLDNMKDAPALVITDSQVVDAVAATVPESVPLTTFSTLFARYKGDLASLVAGAQAIDALKDGDTVLVAEACSHHAMDDDIGRVKIPAWMKRYTGKDLHFEIYAGHDFPEDLERFALCIHCGACMLNRREMLRRIRECQRRGVPVTNYGVAISKLQGVLARIIRPLGME
ncbi:[FeFe] hydrogenase H-cluster maturation GTPase HydF [Desulfobaculum xiamenense]|uniref:[FeFe] hydrogenase H-cluster maturation GTPase HydF n=1 Tax=Desulfobaculum xiamenense TaxID=995050 RepID=A0A846QH65_9BACT|nr:[FeFe] hydrogenase H-cluster maturation GTPase HydF [Desulfobaculum xiamenense]NJB68156.1 [FeFe] hydrogenase H-cluster maturation GTPase HydF [Desulfobaculum xiamenense]